MRYLFSTILLFFFSVLVNAQDKSADPWTHADLFRSSGKIYVVVAVVLLIFLGIIGFLFNSDKKIKQMEKEVKNYEQ